MSDVEDDAALLTNCLYEDLHREVVDLAPLTRSGNVITRKRLKNLLASDGIIWVTEEAFAMDAKARSFLQAAGNFGDISCMYYKHTFNVNALSRYNENGEQLNDELFIYARSPEQAMPAVELLVRQFARETSVDCLEAEGIQQVRNNIRPLPISTVVLESVLHVKIARTFQLTNIRFNSEQCKLLAQTWRGPVNLSFQHCSFQDKEDKVAEVERNKNMSNVEIAVMMDRLHDYLNRMGVAVESLPAFDELQLTRRARSGNFLTRKRLFKNLLSFDRIVWITKDAFAVDKSARWFFQEVFDSFPSGSYVHFFDVHISSLTMDYDTQFREDTDTISIYAEKPEPAVAALKCLGNQFALETSVAYLEVEGIFVAAGRDFLPIPTDMLRSVLLEVACNFLLSNVRLDEEQCKLIAQTSSDYVNLGFRCCTLQDEGAALADAVSGNKGIRKLTFHETDTMSREHRNRLFRGLQWNTRVNELCLECDFLRHIDEEEASDIFESVKVCWGLTSLSVSISVHEHVDLLCSVVSAHRGLKKLRFVYSAGDQYQWCVAVWRLCQLIAQHPMMEELYLDYIGLLEVSPEERLGLTNFLADISESGNIVIRRIQFGSICEFGYNMSSYRRQIWPRLVMKRFLPLFASIQREQDMTRRAKLFGWALFQVKNNPEFAGCQFSFLQRLVSENPDLAIQYYCPQQGRGEASGNIHASDLRPRYNLRKRKRANNC